MADIELVIKIPQFLYKHILKCHVSKKTIAKIFSNGMPLPKGHGRLIDADVFIDGFEDYYELCELVNSTPTIIDADKE